MHVALKRLADVDMEDGDLLLDFLGEDWALTINHWPTFWRGWKTRWKIAIQFEETDRSYRYRWRDASTNGKGDWRYRIPFEAWIWFGTVRSILGRWYSFQMQVLSVEVDQSLAAFNCTTWSLLACSERKPKHQPHLFRLYEVWFWCHPVSVRITAMGDFDNSRLSAVNSCFSVLLLTIWMHSRKKSSWTLQHIFSF